MKMIKKYKQFNEGINQYLKILEEYKKTDKKIEDITIGSWVRTKKDEYEIIDKKNDTLIGKSIHNPNRISILQQSDLLDVKLSHTNIPELKNDRNFDFDNYYKKAGLIDSEYNDDDIEIYDKEILYNRTIPNKIRKGRDKYLQGNRVVLFLDDSRNPFTSSEDWVTDFSTIGTDDIYVKHVETQEEFIKHILMFGLPITIIFDNDLGKKDKKGGSGSGCAAWLVRYCLKNGLELPEWSIISANKYGRVVISNILHKYEELTQEEKKKIEIKLNEGISQYLKGPTQEEVINGLKDKPLKLYELGYKNDDGVIKSVAEKLITPEIKKPLVEVIVELMIQYTSNQLYDDNDIEALSYNDNIYDVSGEEWYKYFSFKENNLEEKLINYHMELPLEELFSYVFEFDVNV